MTLWDFALDVYRRPGVSQACLGLQDSAGVDVNVTLYILWRIAVRADQVGPADVEEADAAIAEWRARIVEPLRALRRGLKTGPSPAPNAETATLRGRIQAAEIDAEHIELDTLESLAPPASSGSLPQDEMKSEARKGLELVVRFYAGGALPDTVIGPIATLTEAL
ncbi:TIGR02444 family protein [Pelagibacterium lacus]|nr:TIGR02444 family protein [Pelagibacterium lacus]